MNVKRHVIFIITASFWRILLIFWTVCQSIPLAVMATVGVYMAGCSEVDWSNASLYFIILQGILFPPGDYDVDANYAEGDADADCENEDDGGK